MKSILVRAITRNGPSLYPWIFRFWTMAMLHSVRSTSAAWVTPVSPHCHRPSRSTVLEASNNLNNLVDLACSSPRRRMAPAPATTVSLSFPASSVSLSRRQLGQAVAAVVPGAMASLAGVQPAAAAPKGPPPMSVDETVLAVRRELQDSSGSLALLQSAADAGDFAALKEITKTMDQSLRKRVVGQAKYYWSDQELATQLSNNITFDLIGINRNTRAGQENAAGVQQYLDDLRQDLTTILVETEKAALLAASGG